MKNRAVDRPVVALNVCPRIVTFASRAATLRLSCVGDPKIGATQRVLTSPLDDLLPEHDAAYIPGRGNDGGTYRASRVTQALSSPAASTGTPSGKPPPCAADTSSRCVDAVNREDDDAPLPNWIWSSLRRLSFAKTPSGG